MHNTVVSIQTQVPAKVKDILKAVGAGKAKEQRLAVATGKVGATAKKIFHRKPRIH